MNGIKQIIVVSGKHSSNKWDHYVVWFVSFQVEVRGTQVFIDGVGFLKAKMKV